jgi:hypothetical protein
VSFEKWRGQTPKWSQNHGFIEPFKNHVAKVRLCDTENTAPLSAFSPAAPKLLFRGF